MKNRVPQIDIKAKPARRIMLVDYPDGTFRVFEDEERTLKAYRPRRGEHVSHHRAFVRREA